jgi:TrmH family RNA methyltransferase
MATVAGPHAQRVARARDLQTVKGRKEHDRYVFEGPTLLEEAVRSKVEIEEIFITAELYERSEPVHSLEASGVRIYVIDERTAAKISDLQTPTGLVAVAPTRLATPAQAQAGPLTLVLADLNDPGNVGTLLRSAEAFGASGVILGRMGVDPHHPKVIRGSMGALFRIPLAVADPTELMSPADGAVVGLDAAGTDIEAIGPRAQIVLVVGHERRGLGAWRDACSMIAAIPMRGPSESLNAAVAGSVALYSLSRSCQESVSQPKSQDFPQ